MYHIDNPEEMSAEERIKEVASILAAGYLRLKKQFPCLIDSQKPSLLTEKELDSSVNKSLHYHEVNQ